MQERLENEYSGQGHVVTQDCHFVYESDVFRACISALSDGYVCVLMLCISWGRQSAGGAAGRHHSRRCERQEAGTPGTAVPHPEDKPAPQLPETGPHQGETM